jgi:hypothetical protein
MKLVDDKLNEMLKAAAPAGIIGTLTALVRALVVQGETPMQKVRTFIAGVVLSIFVGIILDKVDWKEWTKLAVIGSSGAFVSTIWPTLEVLVKKFVRKKGNDVINHTDLD